TPGDGRGVRDRRGACLTLGLATLSGPSEICEAKKDRLRFVGRVERYSAKRNMLAPRGAFRGVPLNAPHKISDVLHPASPSWASPPPTGVRASPGPGPPR